MAKMPTLNIEALKVIDFKEKAQVEASHEDVILTVQDLIEKIEGSDPKIVKALSYFPPEMPFVRLFWLNNQVETSLPKIYQDERGVGTLYDVAPIPQPVQLKIGWISFKVDWNRDQDPKKTVVTGSQILIVKNPFNKAESEESTPHAFATSIGLSKAFVEEIREKQNELTDEQIPQGKGLVPAKYLNYYPRPILPMGMIEKGESYWLKEVIYEQDPRFGSAPRYLLGKLNGDDEISQHEVIPNYAIKQHYLEFGQEPFTVLDKKKKERGYSLKLGLRSLSNVA